MNDELSNIIKESFNLMDKKEYKSAIEMLYPKLTDFPENIEIITQIANCYSSMGEKEQAEQYYEKAFEINNYSTLILDPLIDLKIEQEKYNEANSYTQCYLKCEDKVYAIQKYVEALTKMENYAEIENLYKNEDFNDFNSETYRLIANAIFKNHNEEDEEDIEKAYELAKKATELDKNNIEAYCTLTQYFVIKKDYNAIEETLKNHPQTETSSNAICMLGYKYYMTGNFEQAIAYYSKAVELDEKNEIIYLNLAESYMQLGWLKEAEVIIKKALAINENSVRLRLSLANIYYMGDDFDKTLLTLAFINEIDPNNVEMNLLYTYSYAHQNNFVKANEYAKKLEGKIDSSYIDVNIAKIYYNLGQKEKAFEKFDEAIKKDPNNINILSQKVEYVLEDDNLEEAQKIYDKILEINPNYVDAYYQKSILSIYEKNEEDALKYALKAVEMDCNNAEYQYNLAKLYEYIGEIDKAIDSAKFSLSITPNDINKYWFVGRLYLEKGEIENALIYYKEILNINPNDFENLSRIASSLAAYKMPVQAYEYYQKAFRVNPYDYDFTRKYSDFIIENVSAYKGIKLLLNYKNFTKNKNLQIESKNRAKRLIKENKNRLSIKEKIKLHFK